MSPNSKDSSVAVGSIATGLCVVGGASEIAVGYQINHLFESEIERHKDAQAIDEAYRVVMNNEALWPVSDYDRGSVVGEFMDKLVGLGENKNGYCGELLVSLPAMAKEIIEQHELMERMRSYRIEVTVSRPVTENVAVCAYCEILLVIVNVMGLRV